MTEQELEELITALLELLPRTGRGRSGCGDGGSVGGVLHKLYRLGPLSPGELCRLLEVSGPRVTAMLKELEGKGLLCRSAAPEDRRSVVVTLTDRGRRAVEERLAGRRAEAERLVERIGPDDARALLHILRAAADLRAGREPISERESL